MSPDSLRTVQLDRVDAQHFTATNAQGATINFGNGENEFSPVELLLAAIGGCTAMDVDYATNRHAEPSDFTVSVTANKVGDATGNRLTDLTVSFRVSFP